MWHKKHLHILTTLYIINFLRDIHILSNILNCKLDFGTNQHPTRNEASHIAKEQYPKEQQRHHSSGLFEYRGCKYCSLAARRKLNFSGSGRSGGHETNQSIDTIDLCEYTLPETNIALENRPLEKEIPNFETTIFRGENVSFRECIYIYIYNLLSLFHLFWRYPCLTRAPNVIDVIENIEGCQHLIPKIVQMFVWLVVSTHLKNISQIVKSSPAGDENEKYLKPPPRQMGGFKVIVAVSNLVSYRWWFRNPKQPRVMYENPMKNRYILHVNWLAGFLLSDCIYLKMTCSLQPNKTSMSQHDVSH